MEKIGRVSGVLALVLVLALGVYLAVGPAETAIPRSQYATLIHGDAEGAKLVAESGGEIELLSGATLDVQSGVDTDFGGDVAFGGDATFGGLTILSSTSVTVTDGMTLTPAVSLYRLNAAGGVTLTLNACVNDGQIVYLYGEDNQTVTIVDSNILTHDGGTLSVAQYDLSALICVAGKWAQIAEVANS